MSQESNDRPFKGIPLLLVLLLVLPLAARMMPVAGPKAVRCERPAFVELRGDVPWPGVFFACEPLQLSNGPTTKGIPGALTGRTTESGSISLKSGTRLDVKVEADRVFLSQAEMSPFYKATLGIPILINLADPEAFTAVPGIGLKLAHRIVWERDRRGGFKRIEELMTVSGIGPNLYKRIRPHLAL